MQCNGLHQEQNHCVADWAMHFDSTELLSTPVYGECNAERVSLQ